MDFLPAIVTAAAIWLARWPGHMLWQWVRTRHGLGP